MRETPISNLIEGYYHQDWDMSGPDIWDPLREFLELTSDDQKRDLVDALNVLASEPEGEIKDKLDGLGFAITPKHWELTYGQFVKEVWIQVLTHLGN